MKNLHLSVLLAMLLAGCSSVKDWRNPIERIKPYRIDIQQGNLVTQDMLDRLKPGMTPSQVRFVMGTPLIVDPFRKERWDYVYTLRKDGKQVEKRQITLRFEADRLKTIEGDVQLPAAAATTSGEEAKP